MTDTLTTNVFEGEKDVRGLAFAIALASELQSVGFVETDIDDMDFSKKAYEFGMAYDDFGPYAELLVRPQENVCHRFVIINFLSDECVSEETCIVFQTPSELPRRKNLLPPGNGWVVERAEGETSVRLIKAEICPPDVDDAMDARYLKTESLDIDPNTFLDYVQQKFRKGEVCSENDFIS